MDTRQTLGTYIALPVVLELGLPDVLPHSRWHVHKHNNDTYTITMAEAETAEEERIAHSITRQILHEGFTPLTLIPQRKEGLNARSPHLLLHWYNKAHGRPQNEGEEEGIRYTSYDLDQLDEDHAHIDFTPLSMRTIDIVDESHLHAEKTAEELKTLYEETVGLPIGGVQAPATAVTRNVLLEEPATAPLASTSLEAEEENTSLEPEHPLSLEEQRIQIIEQAMEREFAILLEELTQDKKEATIYELKRMLQRDMPLTWKHKYMFSEFGLALRKIGLHDLALICHQRALQCSPKDVHVLFNLARTEFELHNITAAKSYLHSALEIMPDFTAAKNFLTFLTSQ